MSRRDYGGSNYDYGRSYGEGPGAGDQGSFDDLPPPPYDGEGEGPGSGMEPGGGSYSSHGHAPMGLEPGSSPQVGGGLVYDPFLSPGGPSRPSASSFDPSRREASPFAPPRGRDQPMPSSDNSDLLEFPRASSRSYHNESSSIARQPMIIQPDDGDATHSLRESEPALAPAQDHRRNESSSSSRSRGDRKVRRDRMVSSSFENFGDAPGDGGPKKPQRDDSSHNHSRRNSFDASNERHHEDEVKIAPSPAVVPAVVSGDAMRDDGDDVWRNRDERNDSSGSGSSDPQRPAVVLSGFGGADNGGGGGALMPLEDVGGGDDDLGGGVHSDHDVAQAFQKVDRAKSGKVCAKDLAAFMKRHKIAATPDEIEGLITFAAANMKNITSSDFQRAYRAAMQQDAIQSMAM